MSRLVVNVVFVIFLHVCLGHDAPTVTTRLGKVRGLYKVSYHGSAYEAYEGIPYALPPTGSRRFQPPEPLVYWPSGEINATFKTRCLQRRRAPNSRGDYVIGQEDCLFLNIYTPLNKGNRSLPVVFWIHGGAFQYGEGGTFGAKYLIDYNVILVTINYRLGSLGFLSTEDGLVSGNMGLKDQSVALRWVSDHIESFGGDPRRITLAGLSAGGASVHYHYLSPMSRGLFWTGISFSGTAFDCWTQTQNSREKAKQLAALVDCPTDDLPTMIQCLQARNGTSIVDSQLHFMPWHQNPFTPFGPVVEKLSDEPFIDRSPIEIIQSGDVQDSPWITGVVSEEGLYPVAEFARHKDAMEDLDRNWEYIAPHLLDFNYTIPKSQQANVSRLIRQHYFGNKTINKENLLTLTHLVGDRLFIVDAAKAAQVQAKATRSPVWFFYYNYRANMSLSDDTSNSTEDMGVCHGDDVLLVLENQHMFPTRTKTDLEMHKELIKFWVAVARKGTPKFGPKWLKVDPVKADLDYLSILGPNKYQIKVDRDFAHRLFWDSIDFNENKFQVEKKKIVKNSSSRHLFNEILALGCAALYFVFSQKLFVF